MPYGFSDDAWSRIDENTRSNIIKSQNKTVSPTATTYKTPVTATAQPVTTVKPAATVNTDTSEQRKQADAIVNKLIGEINNPVAYNPDNDTYFQSSKKELLKDADTAYNNANTSYLGNQSGNFNSAALQIASNAKNDLLEKLPSIQQGYEDRFNAKQQTNLANKSSLVNTLLGIDTADYNRKVAADTTDYNRGQDVIANTGMMNVDNILDTIPKDSGLRNIPDYSVAIKNTTDPWRKAQLEALRYQKVMNDPILKKKYGGTVVSPTYKTVAQQANEQAVKTADAQTQWTNAMNLWLKTGTATKTVAKLLGIPEGAKTADYDLGLKGAATDQFNAVTNRINAGKVSKESTNQSENDYYNGLINEVGDTSDGVSFYTNLSENKDAYRQAMGDDNYAKAVSWAQDRYYQTLLSDVYAGTYTIDKLKTKVLGSPEYYKKVLGLENFNAIVKPAKETTNEFDQYAK